MLTFRLYTLVSGVVGRWDREKYIVSVVASASVYVVNWNCTTLETGDNERQLVGVVVTENTLFTELAQMLINMIMIEGC